MRFRTKTLFAIQLAGDNHRLRQGLRRVETTSPAYLSPAVMIPDVTCPQAGTASVVDYVRDVVIVSG